MTVFREENLGSAKKATNLTDTYRGFELSHFMNQGVPKLSPLQVLELALTDEKNKSKEWASVMSALEQGLNQLESNLEQWKEMMLRKLTAASYILAQEIVGASLSIDPKAFVEKVKTLLETSMKDPGHELILHPEDLSFLKANTDFTTLLEKYQVAVTTDAKLPRSTAHMKTDSREFDINVFHRIELLQNHMPTDALRDAPEEISPKEEPSV